MSAKCCGSRKTREDVAGAELGSLRSVRFRACVLRTALLQALCAWMHTEDQAGVDPGEPGSY